MNPASCLFCSHDNPQASKFCNECGAPLHLKPCEQCEAVNDRSARACYRCLSAFPASHREEELAAADAARSIDEVVTVDEVATVDAGIASDIAAVTTSTHANDASIHIPEAFAATLETISRGNPIEASLRRVFSVPATIERPADEAVPRATTASMLEPVQRDNAPTPPAAHLHIEAALKDEPSPADGQLLPDVPPLHEPEQASPSEPVQMPEPQLREPEPTLAPMWQDEPHGRTLEPTFAPTWQDQPPERGLEPTLAPTWQDHPPERDLEPSLAPMLQEDAPAPYEPTLAERRGEFAPSVSAAAKSQTTARWTAWALGVAVVASAGYFGWLHSDWVGATVRNATDAMRDAIGHGSPASETAERDRPALPTPAVAAPAPSIESTPATTRSDSAAGSDAPPANGSPSTTAPDPAKAADTIDPQQADRPATPAAGATPNDAPGGAAGTATTPSDSTAGSPKEATPNAAAIESAATSPDAAAVPGKAHAAPETKPRDTRSTGKSATEKRNATARTPARGASRATGSGATPPNKGERPVTTSSTSTDAQAAPLAPTPPPTEAPGASPRAERPCTEAVAALGLCDKSRPNSAQ